MLHHAAIRRHAWAWVLLTFSLALHVADEALTDFLSFYNPMVTSIRDRVAWFPMPVFTSEVWIIGLITVVLLLFALSAFAFRGASWMAWLSYPYGVLMTLNGLGHMLGSVYFGRLLPGVYSSPILLVTSIWLLCCTVARQRQPEI
jgi:hypothetical protein